MLTSQPRATWRNLHGGGKLQINRLMVFETFSDLFHRSRLNGSEARLETSSSRTTARVFRGWWLHMQNRNYRFDLTRANIEVRQLSALWTMPRLSSRGRPVFT